METMLHLVVVGHSVGLQLVLSPDGGLGGAGVAPAFVTALRGGGAGRRAKLAPCVGHTDRGWVRATSAGAAGESSWLSFERVVCKECHCHPSLVIRNAM